MLTSDGGAAIWLYSARLGNGLNLRGTMVRNASGPALIAVLLRTGGAV